LGLELCAAAPVWESDTVTAIRVPDGVDSNDVVRIAYDRYRTSFGVGLSKVAGLVFRIGHLGDCTEVQCLTALAAAEISLSDAGAKVDLGAGVAAAQNYYSEALARSVN
jgi:alanine-glyoxylate transaminase/serine-glyoxylate transaminase/serine-pyruvate transaminase